MSKHLLWVYDFFIARSKFLHLKKKDPYPILLICETYLNNVFLFQVSIPNYYYFCLSHGKGNLFVFAFLFPDLCVYLRVLCVIY